MLQKEVFTIVVNEKIIRFRIRPYIQEAILQMILDLLVIILVLTVLLYAEFPLIACIAVVVCYCAVELVVYYRVMIQAIIDKRKKDYISEVVNIKKFTNEFSFAGDRTGNSYLRCFYPKEMCVGKHKIIVIGDDGKEKKLRSVMSLGRLLKFVVLDSQQIEQLQVTYLKRSRILISVDIPKDIDTNTNRKRKEANMIDKAVRFINREI